MIARTWPYGTQKVIEVDQYDARINFVCGIEHATKEGFILIGNPHAITPEKGKHYIIEFTRGGPTGGYWRIIKEATIHG